MLRAPAHHRQSDHAGPLAAVWAILAMLLTLSAAGTETIDNPGEAVYRDLCASCHGKNGQGVSGKYEAPLGGERSLKKVTSIIANTMPEDDPDGCVDAEAAKVAQYVYDRFYAATPDEPVSRARVELLRLTNRQYRSTVADLIQRFTGTNTNAGDEHGLRASYFNSKNFKRNTRVEQRIDLAIDFDYGTNSPAPNKINAEEFSVRWQGSVLAPETGDYEFIVKTPNGVRLWVNDDDRALVDASVASGDVNEHSGRLSLLEGRTYPIRLEFFKSKDKTTSIALLWQPPRGVRKLLPPRDLSPREVNPVCVVATPFPPDDSSVGYERGVSVSKAWDDAATQAAIEVANHVISRLDELAGTRPGAEDRSDRIQRFCEQFAETAFRRPLTAEQREIYIDRQLEAGVPLETAAKRIVLLTLKSPRFLFLGLDPDRTDDYAIASRLSFALWDSLPDEELAELAERGQLGSSLVLRKQASRMLRNHRTRAKVRDFLHHWLQLHHVEDLSKDSDLYPDFTPELIADLRMSLDLFLDGIVWEEGADYRRLLLADSLPANNRLADFYGWDHQPGDEFAPVRVDPDQRSGVLTHPYLLAAFAYPRSSSPIHRGVFLTRNIMGRPLKPPPMATAFKDAEFDPTLTMREKVAELTRPEACQTCHSTINPLGFSLENFDAVGRYRTTENDRPIDAASDYTSDSGQTIRLTGARDVAEHAIANPSAQLTFVEQLFHHVVKQPAAAYGADTLERLQAQFADSDYNIQELLVEIALIAASAGPPDPVSATTPTASLAHTVQQPVP